MRTVSLILAVCLLAGLASRGGQDAKKSPPVFPADVRIERGVQLFAESPRQKADIYFPLEMLKGRKLPGIVWVHGGGWTGGSRDAKREISVCSDLARNGYVVMSIDYLLSDKKQTVWPTNLWDCKTAVRWLCKNAARLGVDADRIGVAGGSAGGHLAAMVALTTPADKLDPPEPFGEVSCAVKCCVDLYGISDIGTYHDATMLGKTFAEAPELYRAASPVTYVRSNSVPFLLLHGTADATVDLKQSVLLHEALTKSGSNSELIVVTNAPHTFHLNPPQRDLRPIVLNFLGRNLGAK